MPGNTAANRPSRTLAGVAIFLVGLAVANWPTHAQAQLPSAGVRAVPTYESVGLYWSNPGANAATGCEVKFRRAGDSAWRQGLAMWFDARDSECRGSLVALTQNTSYEVEFNLPGQAATRGLTFSTWANQLPVARTITVAGGTATLNITEGGTASGYVVYQGAPGAVLDANNAAQFNVSVNASYVIVRGLTLKGAQQDAIRISPNVKDVVIEDNDISGWGRTRDGRWGADMDSGVRAVCSTETLERVTIQRNRIHDPRYSANSWSDGHPAGPQAITFSYCGGNHVFRWNEIFSTGGNHFNDGMGGEDNFTRTGFPNADSDIYGNKISQTWDDGIEAEGGNKNVRIWGNFLDRTATGIATTVTSVGPVYIFRNVFSRNQFFERAAHDADDRQPFFKSGSDASLGDGRRYIFHNTMLQATEAGSSYGLGGGAGIGGTGSSQLINNTISMNNIYHLWKPNGAFYQVGTGNAFQNDMFNGSAGAPMVSGINATPTYAAGNGWQSESNGQYQLAAGTPGSQQAARIANFNDVFSGAAPDVGAYEPALGTMKFGLAAAGAAPPPAPNPTPAPAPAPAPTPTPAPTPGNGSTTLGLDSSSYTSTAGQSVTFSVTLSGGAGTPTGTMNFRDSGTSIPGCSSVAISGGVATCSTASLAAGSHSMTALYSGNGVYGTGIAGPITQTVLAGASTPAPAPTGVNVQGLWWRSVAGSESGWGVNLTQQGEKLFATWFTYDADGNGLWLVMSDGVKTGDNAYSGALYRTSGPAYNAAVFDKSAVVRTQVGTASFSFSDASNGVFTASVNGSVVAKPITRLVYAAQVPTCKVGGSAGASPNYQDLWWRTGGSESGWGINITHQGDILFMTWFTYGADGQGLWLLASNVAKTGNGTYSGTLYRTWGPPFDMQPWDPARVTTMPVGSVSFAFTDAENGVFTYTLDGVTQSKQISRLAFSTPASVCR
jgi:Big-like domain-containing protein